MKIFRFFNKKAGFPVGENTLADSMAFIEGTLREAELETKLTMRTLMLAEELIPQLVAHAQKGSELRVQVRRQLGDISVSIRVPGEAFDPLEAPAGQADTLNGLEDEEAQQAIRAILLKSQGDKLKISRKNGVNQVRILADRSSRQMTTRTLIALGLGLLCGLLMKLVLPAAAAEGLTYYALDPIKTVFMNGLKIIIGPVVFFSIVTCISQFKDLSELGRIGAKVMGMYTMTTVIAVLLALGTFALLHPGTPGFALAQAEAGVPVEVDTTMDTSLRSMLIHIVPDNLVKPFLASDTLQIIFLAVLCGAAVGMIGGHTAILQEFFEACNSLFLTITTLFSRLIPLVVFCSVAMMVNDLGGRSLLSVLSYGGVSVLTVLCMIGIYGLLVLAMARLDPITFFKKAREGMITSFTLSSSAAAMPTNMRVCTDKLGISPKVCSFSIPLGATVNMDGTCIYLTIAGLFLARAYNVPVPGASLVSLAITIILLSLGAPGVPGAALVCLGVVLADLGVPFEAVGLIMAINPFVDMFDTMSNTAGDVAAALIVAKSEGLMDEEVFQKKD